MDLAPCKLLAATHTGDIALMEKIFEANALERLADIDTWRQSKNNEHGNNPFHIAAGNDQLEALKLLVSKLGQSSLLTAKNNAMMVPIHEAAINNSIKATEFLLTERRDLVSVKGGNFGHTALHMAACNGHLAMVKLLVSFGASVDEENDSGENRAKPIHMATYYGHVDVVNFLLETKPRLLNERDASGNHLLHWAAVGGQEVSVAFIVGKGVDVNVRQMRQQGNTPLHLAAATGRLESFTTLVQHGADIDAKCSSSEGATAIHLAAFYGKLEVMKFLLILRSDLVTAKDDHGNYLIHWAAFGGWTEMLEWLLEQPGVDIEQKHDLYGYGPLHCAALAGCYDAVVLLVRKGAKVFAARHGSNCDDDQLPIHLAASFGHGRVVDFFVESDPNLPCVRDHHGYLPLHLAAIAGHVDVVASLLNRPGASVDERGGRFGRTALQMAADAGQVAVVRLLLEKGANIFLQNHGDMAIHLAAKRGQTFVLEFLLRKNPELIKRPGHQAILPFHWAAYYGRKAAVELFMRHNARVDMPDLQDRTPLHFAAMGGQLETVKLLNNLGANLMAKSNTSDHGRQPVHLAAWHGHLKIIEYFIDQRPDLLAPKVNSDADGNTLLFYAVQGGHLDVINFLIKRGIDVGGRNKYEQTALHVATELGLTEVADALIKAGADVDARTAPDDSFGPIHVAAFLGHVQVARQLLKAKPELLDSRDGRGNLPLHLAAFGGKLEVVKLLLDNGCDIEAADLKFGRTALHCAVENGCVDLVDLLLNRGAKTEARSNESDNLMTPLHLAAWYGHQPVAQRLLTAPTKRKQLQAKDRHGWTPLNLAEHNRRHHHRQLVSWLKKESNPRCCHVM